MDLSGLKQSFFILLKSDSWYPKEEGVKKQKRGLAEIRDKASYGSSPPCSSIDCVCVCVCVRVSPFVTLAECFKSIWSSSFLVLDDLGGDSRSIV